MTVARHVLIRVRMTSLGLGFLVVQQPTETARVFFQDHFLEETALYLSSSCFSNLVNASARLFVPYLLASHVKYYLNSQTFRHFLTPRENFVMMTPAVHLSSNSRKLRLEV